MSRTLFDKISDRTWSAMTSSGMVDLRNKLFELRKDSMRMEQNEANVLIRGDRGTDCEGVARKVHSNSRLAGQPFHVWNCRARGGLPAIGASPTAGTYYLEGIEGLSQEEQRELYRVFSTAPRGSVRIIASTTPEFDARQTQGAYLPEWVRFVNQASVVVPSISARGTDSVELAKEVAHTCFREAGRTVSNFTSAFEGSVARHTWPGNDRELFCLVERMAWVSNDTVVGDLTGGQGATVTGERPSLQLVVDNGQTTGGYMNVKKQFSVTFERDYLVSQLQKHHGNVSAAAREAKIDRSNFLRLLRRHGIKAEAFRKDSHAAPAVASTVTPITKVA